MGSFALSCLLPAARGQEAFSSLAAACRNGGMMLTPPPKRQGVTGGAGLTRLVLGSAFAIWRQVRLPRSWTQQLRTGGCAAPEAQPQRPLFSTDDNLARSSKK